MRHVLANVRKGEINAREAAEALDVSRRRIYQLYAGYLEACAHHQEDLWLPGRSGGDHSPELSEEAHALLYKYGMDSTLKKVCAVIIQILRYLYLVRTKHQSVFHAFI